MADLILHHYDISPCAEKIRLCFGLKGLPWRSVIVPMVLPKPDLMPLTGGFRRTPVLQIGADVYCDTLRIVIRPRPCPFPAPRLRGHVCDAIVDLPAVAAGPANPMRPRLGRPTWSSP